jgi:hypothetical protein
MTTNKLDPYALREAMDAWAVDCPENKSESGRVQAAIAAYILAVEPEEDEPAPEGVEFDMHVYIHSPKAGASTRLAFPGNRLRPPPSVEVNVRELIDSLGPQAAIKLWAIASDWRVMTRPEIQAYKLRSMGVEVRALDS